METIWSVLEKLGFKDTNEFEQVVPLLTCINTKNTCPNIFKTLSKVHLIKT